MSNNQMSSQLGFAVNKASTCINSCGGCTWLRVSCSSVVFIWHFTSCRWVRHLLIYKLKLLQPLLHSGSSRDLIFERPAQHVSWDCECTLVSAAFTNRYIMCLLLGPHNTVTEEPSTISVVFINAKSTIAQSAASPTAWHLRFCGYL